MVGPVIPVKGTKPAALVVVPEIVPAAKIAGVGTGEAVEEGTGVAATAAKFVAVKKRRANASRVSARSSGVGVAVNLGVRTISGRVSSLFPNITNGI